MALLWETGGAGRRDRCFLDLRGRLLQLRFSAQDQPDITHLPLTGLRGSHVGLLRRQRTEFATELSRERARNRRTRREDYDVVIVGGRHQWAGGGVFFWRAKNPNARILILDNHD